MEQVCEILWEKSENEKNMTLIMCIEEPLINKTNNSIFFNELNANLSKFNKNSSLENKTKIAIVNNINKTSVVNNMTFPSPTPSWFTYIEPSTAPSSVTPSIVPSVTPSIVPSVIPSSVTPSSVTPSIVPSVTPSSVTPSIAPSPYYVREEDEIVINDLNIINPSSSTITKNYETKNNSVVEVNSDNTSLIVVLISGGLVIIIIIIYIVKKYRSKFSIAPCPPIITSNNKDNYVKKPKNINKPKDYILEILPGTPRSALFNRVPIAKKVSSSRRTRSLPRKTVRRVKLKRRVNSLPDLKKVDIEKNRRKDKLPPLPLRDNTPPIPIRSERIRRLVEIKKKMREQKENNIKLMTI